ncbi:MAG: metalloregulator ArsR/SmtB family transcription factor [Lentisphaeraceae bacterium]|nr:metalloregulator ArsR/SmtB family transcription factor [Lentisphaeraceae bacterium]
MNVDPKNCKKVAEILKNLSHPQRLMILCYLSMSPKNVNELTELTECSQSAVSQFLTRMKHQGLIESEREGHFVNYRITDPKVLELMESLHRIYGES